MIDLHVHSTASDGLLAPDALVDRLASAGITAFSLTDHDTVAGIAPAAEAARRRGLEILAGIEITAVHEERDVHVLGYGIDPGSAELNAFLARQRAHRIDRARQIVDRLRALGAPVDVERQLAEAAAGGVRVIGRPHLARALVEAGHVASVQEAFETLLGRGRPAFVPRTGASIADVVAIIGRAGGLASLAHPGLTRCDAVIPALAASGLRALEVWHGEHDEAMVARYLALAERLGLLATGGSDFHGDDAGRPVRLGEVGIPPEHYSRLLESLAAPHGATGR
ncbi:MAG TPA: PHP domain-containing protein [Vicinamibacterales bacterium]